MKERFFTQEKGAICILTADSCCTVEANTTLLSNYPSKNS